MLGNCEFTNGKYVTQSILTPYAKDIMPLLAQQEV